MPQMLTLQSRNVLTELIWSLVKREALFMHKSVYDSYLSANNLQEAFWSKNHILHICPILRTLFFFTDCADPTITNGVFTEVETATNFEATFSCNTGYGLVGNPVVVCNIDNKAWDPLPTCDAGK